MHIGTVSYEMSIFIFSIIQRRVLFLYGTENEVSKILRNLVLYTILKGVRYQEAVIFTITRSENPVLHM